MSAPALVFSGVVRRFRRGSGFVDVLNGLSFALPAGAIAAITGPNGSGKSTAIRIASTVVEPTSGRVSVLGHDTIEEPGSARQHVGLSLGVERSFYWRLSGGWNLLFAAGLRGLHGSAARSEVQRVALACGLDSALRAPVRLLSRGMRARLGFARACLGSPGLLLLDEPFASVDADGRAIMWRCLRDAAGRGAAVLVATHEASAVARCGRVVSLAGGTA